MGVESMMAKFQNRPTGTREFEKSTTTNAASTTLVRGIVKHRINELHQNILSSNGQKSEHSSPELPSSMGAHKQQHPQGHTTTKTAEHHIRVTNDSEYCLRKKNIRYKPPVPQKPRYLRQQPCNSNKANSTTVATNFRVSTIHSWAPSLSPPPPPPSTSPLSGRPLPPPPRPEPPKLVPAHYAYDRLPSPTTIHSRPQTRDIGVDTSDVCEIVACSKNEKEIQCKFIGSRPASLASQDSIQNPEPSTPIQNPEEDDDERTIQNSVVSSVYHDAPSRFKASDNDNVDEPYYYDDEDDCATINDDLSSLSSQYHSICASSIASSVQFPVVEGENSTNSWLHQRATPAVSTTATSNTHDSESACGVQLESASIVRDCHQVTGSSERNQSERPQQSQQPQQQQQPQQFFLHSPQNSSQQPSPPTIIMDSSDVQEEKQDFDSFQRAFHFSSMNASSTESDDDFHNLQANLSTPTRDATSVDELSDVQRVPTNQDTLIPESGSPSDGDVESNSLCSLDPITNEVRRETFTNDQVVFALEQNALPENLCSLPQSTPGGNLCTKQYYTAHELYLTERDYVERALKLICVDFRQAIQDVAPTYFLARFFKPLEVVLPVHELLVTRLRTRVLEEWDDKPKISDIMIELGPYLKEYSIFASEYDTLIHLLDEVQHKFEQFDCEFKKFEKSPRLRKLPFKSFLLNPVNRLGKYPLLLNTYLKTLAPDHDDYADMQKAVEIITDVANHVNEHRRAEEKGRELTRLKERIYIRDEDFFKAGRELIKHGKLDKLSRRESQERYFVLFNDALFYMRPVMNGVLSYRATFPLEGMEVELSSQSDNEFVVQSTQRSFALIAETPEDRDEWVAALRGAIHDNDEKLESFEAAKQKIGQIVDTKNEDSCSLNSVDSGTIQRIRRNSILTPVLGERPPVWVNDNRATMCQKCAHIFNRIFNRRHHCRACGSVVCNDCSAKEFPLKFHNNTPQRVCDDCYDKLSLQGTSLSPKTSPNTSFSTADARTRYASDGGVAGTDFDQNHNPSIAASPSTGSLIRNNVRLSSRGKKNIPSVRSEVPANDSTCMISGYLGRFQKKAWKQHWCLIKDFVLYIYNASHDIVASETLPLPGYNVIRPTKGIAGSAPDRIIQLAHPGQAGFLFLADTKENCDKWFKFFSDATQLQRN